MAAERAPGLDNPADTLAVHALLVGHLGPGVEALAPLAAGAWSRAYSFRRHGAECVLRIGCHGDSYERDRCIAAQSSPDLPVPEVLETGRLDGHYYCLSRRAHGAMLEELDTGALRRALPAVLRMLDAIRELDPGPRTGYGPWLPTGDAPYSSWREYLLSVAEDVPGAHCAGWRARLERFPTSERAFREACGELQRLTARLEDHGPTPRHVVHTDLLHRNVLVENDRIAAVLDWGNSILGDFLYDLATFTFYAAWYPAMEGLDWAGVLRRHLAGAGREAEHFGLRLRCCELHLGLGDMAFNAFLGNGKQLEWTARRTLQLARAPAGD